MVTMSSDKPAQRKSDAMQQGINAGSSDSCLLLLLKKMEKILEQMQLEGTGVPIKTVKNFMSKTPAVFTGCDLIAWMMKNLDVDDQAEALHLANMLASYGYLFPVEDTSFTVKNDNTFYRFQTPYYWPSNNGEPENTDYALYLCKRTLLNKKQKLLADYEAENLSKLQKMFSRKWDFISLQAEAQIKLDKKRDKMERKIIESQEKAFWSVHRPMPGAVNITEIDIRKVHRPKAKIQLVRPQCTHECTVSVVINDEVPSSSSSKSSIENLKQEVTALKLRLERRNIKICKIAETYISYFEQYIEYDPFFTPPELPNPWLSDNAELWDQDKLDREISSRRIKKWGFSLHELLADTIGRQHFMKFLEKEFSSENLKFWEAVQHMKALPLPAVGECANEIWLEYLAPDATCPINVDSQSHELSKKNMQTPDRWAFDIAAAHVYHLMKSDSYSRYLRSDMYKEFLNGSKKKACMKGIRSIVSFSSSSGRKDPASVNALST